MFGKKKQPPIKSLIAHGTEIHGDVRFADGMRVDGAVHGHLLAHSEAPTLLVISEAAKVVGEVRAGHVIINGEVHGPVCATELLELQPKARIQGDVSYRALEMHQGATIAGQLLPLGEGALDKPTLKLAAIGG
ncbi:bactofilin family protein [Hydrogenophaga sp. OTU3427]|uniref:bactofilin family protein n=1 Tax=Hydrogenophaga sp. OTU3427 TaxID=3043856 RepID=UPI00313B6D63